MTGHEEGAECPSRVEITTFGEVESRFMCGCLAVCPAHNEPYYMACAWCETGWPPLDRK